MKHNIAIIALLTLFVSSLAAATHKPNVVFFLVDDMGWMDCGVYGSRYYETPNLVVFLLASRLASAVWGLAAQSCANSFEWR